MTTERSGAALERPVDPGDLRRDAGAFGAWLPRENAWRPFYRLVAILFIAFPIVNALSYRSDAIEIALVAGGTALFAAVTLINFRPPAALPVEMTPSGGGAPLDLVTAVRRVGPSVAAVVALLVVAILLCLYRPEAGWFAFFYYASVAASTVRIGRVAVALMVIAGIGAAVAFELVHGDPGSAFVQGLSVTVIGTTVYSAVAVRRTNRQLVAFRHELARLAVADERARIARDLHDTLGHHLTALSIQLEVASRLTDGVAAGHIREAQAVAKLLLGDVRDVVSKLRDRGEVDLSQAIRALARTPGTLDIHLDLPHRLEVDDPAQAHALLRCVQEIITNTARHASARNLWIVVSQRPDGIDLHARDDGRGASLLEVGNGLRGMRERFEEYAGRVEFSSRAGEGFEVRGFMPRGRLDLAPGDVVA